MSTRKRFQVKRQGTPTPGPSSPVGSSSGNSQAITQSCTPSGASTICIAVNAASPTSSTVPSDSITSMSAQTGATSSPSTSSSVDTVVSSSSDAGTIAGCVVGGVVFLVLVVVVIVLYLRARKRNRTPPSSEFMNSLRDGAAPVLRLDSGAEYTPALPEKGGGHVGHHLPAIALPFLQSSYYTSPPMQDTKFPDELMMTNIPSRGPSIDRPLHPQRYSAQHANESFVTHNPSSSVGSRRELWGSDTEIAPATLSPMRQSPSHVDSVLQFSPHFSLYESSPQSLQTSHSPTSLQPLRRQPD